MKNKLKFILIFALYFTATNQIKVYSQSLNIDSLSKIVFKEVDSIFKNKINDLTRMDEHIIDRVSINGAKFDLYQMKLLSCFRYRSYRKFKICMCSN